MHVSGDLLRLTVQWIVCAWMRARMLAQSSFSFALICKKKIWSKETIYFTLTTKLKGQVTTPYITFKIIYICKALHIPFFSYEKKSARSIIVKRKFLLPFAVIYI